MSHEDGQIPHDAHLEAAGSLSDSIPLAEEEILAKAVCVDAMGESDSGVRQRRRVAVSEFGRPLGPRAPALVLLDGHEECEILQPFGLGRHEAVVVGVGLEAAMGAVEHLGLPLDQRPEIDLSFWEVGHRGEVVGRQEVRLDQLLEADQVGVPRKRREALIGRVAEPGRPEGKNLPEFAACGRKPIQPGESLRSQLADPVGTWQRRRM